MQKMITSFSQAMEALGVTEDTLTPEEKNSLDELGYVIFHNLIDKDWLERLRNRFEQLVLEEGDMAGTEFKQEAGTRRLADLINKGPEFDGCYTHPKILAATYYVIKRDFKVNSINARDALPGEGHQALHADWGAPNDGKNFHIVNSIWLLDDLTSDNGATRLVPGTHLIKGRPQDYMTDPKAPHPDEMLLIAQAGSVLVYNAHLWHGGTENRTSKMRRVLHPSFIAKEFNQQYDQKKLIQASTLQRISPAARYLLDID